jgi:hypothetical protein
LHVALKTVDAKLARVVAVAVLAREPEKADVVVLGTAERKGCDSNEL